MVGIEHDGEEQINDILDDNRCMFNIILQDGTRSDNAMTVDGTVWKRYDYFLPQKKRITKVTIYFKGCILGFRFHLSNGSEWDIGRVDWFEICKKTVEISDNEVIVGFKAKSQPKCPA